MKMKFIAITSALAVTCLSLVIANRATAQSQDSRIGSVQHAGSEIAVATPITPQEAAKKFPAPNGKYPLGERDPHKPSGVVASPYAPHTPYDCSKIAHGGLVLDTKVNKVFVRP
jgi:hypothetical protein